MNASPYRAVALGGLAIFILVFFAACGYQGSLGEVACDEEADCPAGASCDNGFCVLDEDPDCDEDQLFCDGRCIDPGADDEHCGSCGNVCFEGQTCQNGSCEDESNDTTCDEGQIRCGDACVDLSNDDAHCGDCGAACADGLSCRDSQCQCPQGQQFCDGQCVDTDSNTQFCGDCQTTCGDEEYCVAGECALECDEDAADQLICGDACVDPQTNANHCGGCDRACGDVAGADGSCVDGQCIYECSDAENAYCDAPDAADDTGQGICVDTATSTDHCLGCNNACPDDGPENAVPACSDSGCTYQCTDDLAYCSADISGVDNALCADLMADIDHCGSCANTCDAVDNGSPICQEGSCDIVCDSGFDQCTPGACTDLMTNPTHCGACDNQCGDDEICTDGGCEPVLACDPDVDASEPFYPFGGGSGSAGDPYTICTAAQLAAIDDDNGDHLASHFILTDHIDLSAETFAPLARGTFTESEVADGFAGHLDGNDYEIRNLTIDAVDTNRAGLFGMIQGGTVDNLTLINADVTGANFTGGLTGINLGTVTNSSVQGTISGANRVGGVIGGHDNSATAQTLRFEGSVTGDQRVGGIAGHSGGTIGDSFNLGDITGTTAVGGIVGFQRAPAIVDEAQVGQSAQDAPLISGDTAVGGVAGLSAGQVLNSQSWATISATTTAAGGLVGDHDDSAPGCTILDSEAHGNINATDANIVGGLVGDHRALCTIENSFATGDVAGNDAVGGLVGTARINSEITTAHATGMVSGIDDVGGLIGRLGGAINDAYATGTVAGENNLGGLVGYVGIVDDNNFGTIAQSHATGAVSGENNLGGLVGLHDGNIDESYATGAVDGDESTGGLVGRARRNSDGGFNPDWIYRARIRRSYATGDVTGNFESGGLVGYNNGIIRLSFATGNVAGDDEAGGLIGSHYARGELNDSYATGAVSGSERIGGLVGRVWGTNLGGPDGEVTRCYATGDVSGGGEDEEVGELIGRNRGNINDSFWRTDSAGDDYSDGGAPLSPTEFTDQNNFTAAGWTFPTPWTMASDRPVLTEVDEP